MNVLSLFDGISCGHLALDKIGIPVDKYYASEIDNKAIQVTQNNYPDTIQLGDVVNLNEAKLKTLPKIDLLIGGSPCQGFSVAGKQLNFEDERSKLFFEYVRILNWIKKYNNKNVYFLFENVKMKEEISSIIDNILCVKKIFIDSRYFTGHIRKRYYWTNIPIKNDYIKKDINLEDIIDNSIPYDRDVSYYLPRTPINPTTSYDGIITINPKDNNGKQTWQRGRIYDIKGKCPTICASLFDLNITKDRKFYRKLTIKECEKLQGVPCNYLDGVGKNNAGKMLGNGWTVDVIAYLLSGIERS